MITSRKFRYKIQMKFIGRMMQYQWLLLVMLTLGIHEVYCIQPEYVWPLGEFSGAREALIDAEMNHPLDHLYVGNGHPSLSYRALSLETADNNIIVNLPKNLTLFDFTFSLYFFPIESSGPVFTYEASNGETDGITGINVVISNSVINISFFKSPNEIFFYTTAHTVEINQWNFLAFERNYDTGVIKVFNATSFETESAEEAIMVGSLGSGKIRFGSNVDNNLLARFTCAAVYRELFSTIDVTVGYNAFDECANPSAWPFYNSYDPVITNTSLLTASETLTTEVTTTTGPPLLYIVKIWPMNNVSFGYSSTGKSSVYPKNSECFRLSDDGLSLMFDGSSRSYLEQMITVDVIQHITIAMLLKPGFKTSGTVFQFVGESATIQVELFIDGKDLTLTLTDATSVCGTLKSIGAVVQGAWNFVRVHFKHDMFVVVNGTVTTNTTQCSSMVNTPTVSGRLLLGANVNGGSHFRGSMSCLVVFQGFFNGSTADLESICQSNSFTPIGINMKNCDLIPEIRETTFGLKATNAKPTIGVPLLMKVHTKPINCAKLCVKTEHCLSFVTKRKFGTAWCYLYDFQTDTSGLVYSEKAKYFVAD